jgi:uncharacterized protein (DUF1501 family)
VPSQTGKNGCSDYLRTSVLHRREFLRVGGLSLMGLSLPALFAAETRAFSNARARSCIFLFLSGGPSQFETFDPKPDAPAETRSLFGTLRTRVPGTLLGEYLPDLAALADRFALVRSVWHRYTGHFGGHRYALTGFAAPGRPDQPARVDDHPGIISLALRSLPRRGSFPPAVMLPWLTTDQGSGSSGGMGGGTLGKQYDPLLVEADPASLDTPIRGGPQGNGGGRPFPVPPGRATVFRVPEFTLPTGMVPNRFALRRTLLEEVEAQRRQVLDAAAADEMDTLYRQAYELLGSARIREGFDITREAFRLRERYGLNAFGQSCLMARRLIERGARFVQVNFGRFVTHAGYGWDTHRNGRDTLKDHLLPKLNAGLAALLLDLEQRGLLDETLVVAMGEFGRTPRLKPDGGRDHWPGCYSALFAGGGVHGGLVLGRSDRTGAQPATDAIEARDLLVTILTLLGIPTTATDLQGRTAPLFPEAGAIERLYG